MADAKPLASLTSGLLARRGGARPAMRRQPLGSGPAADLSGHDDLGWNDMGYDVDPVGQSAEPLGGGMDLRSLMAASMPAQLGRSAADAALDGGGLPIMHAAQPDADEVADGDHEGGTAGPGNIVPAADSPLLHRKPAVVRQRELLAAQMEAPLAQPAAGAPVMPAAAPVRARAAVAERTSRADTAAFTLRLTSERHLRLRLASAVFNRSCQQIMVEMLDQYLAELPEIEALAGKAAGPLVARRANRTSNIGETQ